MRNKNHFIKKSKYLLFLLLFTICSCATFTYTNSTITKPVNVKQSEGKWLIDEPVVNKVDPNYETVTINYYEKLLNKKFNELKSIKEFNNITSLKKNIGTNLKVLEFYKQQTGFDYLISTKLNLIKNDDDALTKELNIKIIVYDLNTKILIFEKEYNSYDKFTGFDDSPLPSRLSRFMDLSIEKAIKDFGDKKNWSAFNSIPN